MASGKVKWFSEAKGYGFISTDEGKDIFVHFSAIRGTGRRNLSEGQDVEFEVVEGPKGPQASDVAPVA
jgi:CspA family cold shock protein